MALSVLHPLSEMYLTAFTASVGATPVTAHAYIPFRCKVVLLGSILGGVITTANAAITCSIGATAITGGVIDIEDSGSAVGDLDTATPTALNLANEGDVLSFVPTLASGTAIPCHFFAIIRRV